MRHKPAPVAVSTPAAPSSSRGLRVEEAAEYLGTTVSFVRRSLIGNHEVPALLLGKRHIILKEDLDEYLDAQRRRA